MDDTYYYNYSQFYNVHPAKRTEELVRLFGECRNNQADVMEEFRRNGRDVDYQEDALLQSEIFKLSKNALGQQIQPRTCVFCKANGETSIFFTGHSLKDELGRVVCPVLAKYTCPLCGATGERAHTIKYCPLRPLRCHFVRNKAWERNAVGRVVPAKKFLQIHQ